MADRYVQHICGCLEEEIKNAEDGYYCKIGVVTAQGALDIIKEQAEQIERFTKTEEQKQAERKQKRREWQAKYRESHRQQAYQTTKEWRKNNPDKVKAQRARYRERQRMKKVGDGNG